MSLNEGEIEMGMTMTQKILAAHAGLDSVKAGQLIEANLDIILQAQLQSMNLKNVVPKAYLIKKELRL